MAGHMLLLSGIIRIKQYGILGIAIASIDIIKYRD